MSCCCDFYENFGKYQISREVKNYSHVYELNYNNYECCNSTTTKYRAVSNTISINNEIVNNSYNSFFTYKNIQCNYDGTYAVMNATYEIKDGVYVIKNKTYEKGEININKINKIDRNIDYFRIFGENIEFSIQKDGNDFIIEEIKI